MNPEGGHFKNTSIRPQATRAGSNFPAQEQDQRLVLQKCLDLEVLQPYYPKARSGEYQQLYVLQHGVSFPSDMAVWVGGKALTFIGKSDLASGKIEAYFLFYEFAIAGETARVDFVYNYDQTSTLKKMLVVSLDLQKTGNSWTIVEQKMEERES